MTTTKIELSDDAKVQADALVKAYDMADFAYLETFVRHVKSVEEHRKSAKDSKVKQNRSKIESYAYWLPTVADFLPVWEKRGRGSKKAAGELREQLDAMLKACGVSKPNARRYIENARGLLLKSPEVVEAAQAGPNAMTAWFADNEIKTETALKKLWAKSGNPLDALAKKIAHLSKAEHQKLDALVEKHEQKIATEKAKQAEKAKQKEPRPEAATEANTRKTEGLDVTAGNTPIAA